MMKKTAEITGYNEQKTQRIAVSPIDVNSIRLGTLDVNKDLVDYAFVVFSFLLVVVGGLQWWVYRRQAGYMCAQLKSMQQTTEVLIAQNSPYFRLSGLIRKSANGHAQIVYSLRNYGGGSGFLREMSNNIILSPGQMPSVPSYQNIRPFSPVGISLGHMDHLPVPITFQESIRTVQDIDNAMTNGSKLFVYGYVKFSDTLRREHTLGFGYEYTGERFVEAGGSAYNYRRCEKEPDNDPIPAN